MEFPYKNSSPPAQPSSEDEIQNQFDKIQPEVITAVDLDRTVKDTFNSDFGTDKIKKVFYDEIDKGDFAKKVQDIITKARKIKTYDNTKSLIDRNIERILIFVLGLLFSTFIWPFLKSIFTTTPTP